MTLAGRLFQRVADKTLNCALKLLSQYKFISVVARCAATVSKINLPGYLSYHLGLNSLFTIALYNIAL